MNSLYVVQMRLPVGNVLADVYLPEPIAATQPAGDHPLAGLEWPGALECVDPRPSATRKGEEAQIDGMVARLCAGPITPRCLAEAHRDLPVPRAGMLRQNMAWMGAAQGSDKQFTPPADMLPMLLDDLCAFLARTDLETPLQAAVAFCQLILIHPFSDGNGRLARALLCAVLRRHGATRRATMRLLSSLAYHQVEHNQARPSLSGTGAPYWAVWRRIFEPQHRSHAL